MLELKQLQYGRCILAMQKCSDFQLKHLLVIVMKILLLNNRCLSDNYSLCNVVVAYFKIIDISVLTTVNPSQLKFIVKVANEF